MKSLAVIAYAFSQVGLTQVSPDRLQITGQSIAAAEEIVRKTKDPAAAEVLTMIKADFVTCVPLPGGQGWCERNARIKIYPLLPGDEKLPGQWARLYHNNMVAMFQPRDRLILKTVPRFSRVFQGLMIIHEGKHALEYQKPMVRNPTTEIEEEVMVRTMVNRLISLLGGPLYQTLLEKEIKRVRGQIAKTRSFTYRPSYDARLNRVFGAALSAKEEEFRMQTLTIQACFAVYDRFYPKQARRLKFEQIERLYK